MNFLDLYKKIKNLDEGLSQGNMMPQAISAPPSSPIVEKGIEECGPMGECGEMNSMSPKQQDSVSMNVTMSGQGSGGIRDLMNILRNIEDAVPDNDHEPMPQHEPHDDDEIIIGQPDHVEPEMLDEPEEDESMKFSPEEESLDEEPEEEEDYANRPDVRIKSIAAITDLGDDLASKGKEALKQAGGGNPWNVSESAIAEKLSKHYAEVKTRMTENNFTQYGYGDPQTWGGRSPEPEPSYYDLYDHFYGYGNEEADEVAIPAPHDLPKLGVQAGQTVYALIDASMERDDFTINSITLYDEHTDDYTLPIDLKLVNKQWLDKVYNIASDHFEKQWSEKLDPPDNDY